MVMRNHPLCNTWYMMKHRCQNPKNIGYYLYGGRGIEVCDRWLDFWAFVEDMGERPEGHTLDRIDNDGPYAPWNCRWATGKEQKKNSRRNRNERVLVYQGEALNVAEWARKLGIKYITLSKRIDRGWSVERALSV